MTKPTQAQIEAAMAAYDKTFASGEPVGRARRAMKAALTAAAEVAPDYKTWEQADRQDRNVTIERCAQIADTWEQWSKKITAVKPHEQIAAAIRALKDK